MAVEVKTIEAQDTFQIRQKMLRSGTSLPVEMSGDEEQHTLHLGVYDQGVLCGIASFMRTEASSDGERYQLRGMAVDADFHGRGLGRVLMEDAERRLKARGAVQIWCNAREAAKGFYLGLGYRVEGAPFEVDQIGSHFVMRKNLN